MRNNMKKRESDQVYKAAEHEDEKDRLERAGVNISMCPVERQAGSCQRHPL